MQVDFYGNTQKKVVKKMSKDNEKYSFSKLSTFHECRMQYFLQYIMKMPQKENIYSNLGSCIHEILEKRQKNNQFDIDNDVEKFIDEVETSEMFGIDFPNEKIKNDYINCIIHCLKTLKPFNGKTEIEKELNFEIDNIKIVGYVDCIHHLENGKIDIYDYKTSSLYSKKQLEEKAMQLILYAIGLEKEGYEINSISWIFLKYATIQGVRKEKNIKRSELTDNQEFEPCIYKWEYNEKEKQRAIDWVKNTVEEINNCKEFNEWEAKKITKYNSFGCQHICSVCGKCEALKQYLKTFKP